MINLLVAIAFFLTFLATLYLVLRNGGLVDHLISARDKKVQVLEQGVLEMTSKYTQLVAEVAQNASKIENNNDAVRNRLKALETKYGIDNKKMDKTAMMQQFAIEANEILNKKQQR